MPRHAHVLATVEYVEVRKLDGIDVGLGLVELRLRVSKLA